MAGGTVIDELVVTLGLDPRQFSEGQRKALDEFKRNQKDFKKETKDASDAAEKSLKDLGMVAKNIMEFTGVAVGAAAIKEYARETVNMGLELGRTATILGTSTNMLSAWQGAAIVTGGTIAGVTSSIRNLVGSMLDLTLTGNTSAIPLMASIGMRPTFDKNGVLDYNKTILDAATAIKQNHIDQAHAAYVLGKLGMDDATTALILSGPENVKAKLALAHEYAPSPEDVKDLTAMATAWNTLDLAMTSFGRDLVLAPWRDWTTLLAGLNPGVLGSFVGSELVKHGPSTPKRVHKDDLPGLALYAPGQLAEATAGEVTGFFGPATSTGPTPKAKPGSAGRTGGGGPVAKQSSWKQIVDFFIGKGWSAAQAAGIAAQAFGESGFNAFLPGDKGAAFGLFQWHADRQANFEKLFHHSIKQSTLEEQLEFANWELHNTEHAAGRLLAMAITPADAAEVATRRWIRPLHKDHDAKQRAEWATQYSQYVPSPKGHISAAAGLAQHLSLPAPASSGSNVTIGTIVVHTQATDANGIAQDIGPAVKRNLLASLANSGQQ